MAQIEPVRGRRAGGSTAELSHELLAREHQIDTVLNGALQRSGEEVRITVRLTQARTGRSIWARSYDGDMRGILGLQDQVVRGIAERIRVDTASERPGSMARPQGVSPAAYEAYVRGIYFLGKVTEADFRKGIEYFTKAIDLEADSYYGLAECYAELGYYTLGPPHEHFPKSRAAALKALELDPTLAGAHASLGRMEFLYSWDLESADREYRKALELNPSSARIRLTYHTYLAAMGRAEESIAQARASVTWTHSRSF